MKGGKGVGGVCTEGHVLCQHQVLGDKLGVEEVLWRQDVVLPEDQEVLRHRCVCLRIERGPTGRSRRGGALTAVTTASIMTLEIISTRWLGCGFLASPARASKQSLAEGASSGKTYPRLGLSSPTPLSSTPPPSSGPPVLTLVPCSQVAPPPPSLSFITHPYSSSPPLPPPHPVTRHPETVCPPSTRCPLSHFVVGAALRQGWGRGGSWQHT